MSELQFITMTVSNPLFPLLEPEIRTLLEKSSTATLATQLFKRGFRTRFMTGVSAVHPDLKLVGTARTLRCVPMREDLDHLGVFRDPEMPQRKAVERVGPGEVLVIDARGDRSAGTLGNILAARIMRRGAAGVVSDGPFRDLEGIRALRFPSYCAGPHANTNLTVHHPVDMDVPIGCGGVLVMPGDVLVGDGDGVIVIPRHLAAEIATDAAEQELAEEFILEKIQAGASIVGVYPMNDETAAEYEQWRRERE
jgi:regulator of RNase E activity RraA